MSKPESGSNASSDAQRHLIGIQNLAQRAKQQAAGTPKRVTGVGVIGAGVMGRCIALIAARAGLGVTLTDTAESALQQARAFIEQDTKNQVERGKMSNDEMDQLLARIGYSTDIAAHKASDVVIEAIVENLAVKQKVLGAIHAINPNAIIATNTSSLSVAAIGESVVGMHFFNPAHKMPLVEVVRSETANANDVATVVQLALKLGKTPVVVADRPGFLVNRVLGTYFAEAAYLAKQGVGIAQIDAAMTEFGMPMGPFRLLDEVGFDIAGHVAENLTQTFGSRMVVGFDLSALAREGILGKKSDSGFWFPGGKELNTSVLAHLGLNAEPSYSMTEEEIQTRLVFVMLNELAECIGRGVVQDTGLADLAMILGTGFPVSRGGLFAWWDDNDTDELRGNLDDLAARERENRRIQPASWFLQKLAFAEPFRPDVATQ